MTYEDNCDDGKCHHSMALCHCNVALLDSLPCLDDTGLLLLELKQIFDLHLVSTPGQVLYCIVVG